MEECPETLDLRHAYYREHTCSSSSKSSLHSLATARQPAEQQLKLHQLMHEHTFSSAWAAFFATVPGRTGDWGPNQIIALGKRQLAVTSQQHIEGPGWKPSAGVPQPDKGLGPMAMLSPYFPLLEDMGLSMHRILGSI